MASLILVLFAAMVLTGCVKTAPPGTVAIKVNLAGDNRGVEDIPLETGRILYFPLTQDVIVYPTYMQSETYRNVVFNSIEGLRVEADVTVAFTLDAEKVPALYVRYRRPIEEITSTYLYRTVRTTLANIASQMDIDSIYGERKAWLAEQLTEKVREELAPIGFNIEYIAFEGDLVLPERVRQAIDEKIEATQRAIRAENELRQAEAEARKAVAAAEGEAESIRARAEGEAQAILIKAQAEAKANQLLIESLGGPEYYVRLRTIEELGKNVNVMLLPNDAVPVFGVDGLIRQGR